MTSPASRRKKAPVSSLTLLKDRFDISSPMLRDGPSPPAPPGAIGRICGSEASGMADQLLEHLERRVTPGLTPYPDATAGMEAWVDAIRTGNAPDRDWLPHPPPLYTPGPSAARADLVNAPGFT